MFKIIVAVDANYGIGYEGKMPWHIPSELKHYRETTGTDKVVYGATTFNNLPKLANQNIYVLGKVSGDVKNTYTYIEDLTKFIEKHKDSKEVVWVCGGEQTYKTFMPWVQEIIMTKLKKEYTVDRYFVNFDEFTISNTVEEIDYNLVKYRRK